MQSAWTEIRLKKALKRKKQMVVPNADRPIVSCPETQNDLGANKTTSRNKINNASSYSQVQEHRLQTPKKVKLGHVNVNVLRNKIEAVEELTRNNIGISLFSETKLQSGANWK